MSSEIIEFDSSLKGKEDALLSKLAKFGFFSTEDKPVLETIETKKIKLGEHLLDLEKVKGCLLENNNAEELINLILENSDILIIKRVIPNTGPRTNLLGFMSADFFAKLDKLQSSTLSNSQT